MCKHVCDSARKSKHRSVSIQVALCTGSFLSVRSLVRVRASMVAEVLISKTDGTSADILSIIWNR